MELPKEDNDRASFQVQHERIPDFVNAQGKVVGMDSMTMPFPLAEGVTTRGVEVGDKVELEFQVDWSPGRRGWWATAIRPLPAETALDFGAAPGNEAAHGSHDHDHDHDHGH